MTEAVSKWCNYVLYICHGYLFCSNICYIVLKLCFIMQLDFFLNILSKMSSSIDRPQSAIPQGHRVDFHGFFILALSYTE